MSFGIFKSYKRTLMLVYMLVGMLVLLTLSLDAASSFKTAPNLNIKVHRTLSDIDQRLQCEYYKYQATTFCKSNYSEIDQRQECIIIHKQRWCDCMGLQKDCYKQQSFYW